MIYINDASQVVFLLLALLVGAIAFKVFFLDGRGKPKQ